MEVNFTTQQLLNTSRLIRILAPCIKLNASLKIYLVSDKVLLLSAISPKKGGFGYYPKAEEL